MQYLDYLSQILSIFRLLFAEVVQGLMVHQGGPGGQEGLLPGWPVRGEVDSGVVLDPCGSKLPEVNCFGFMAKYLEVTLLTYNFLR